MTEKFEKLISSIATISATDMDKISRTLSLKTIKKHAILLGQGQICREFCYLEEGCMRSYYVTNEGKEKTRLIIFDNSPVIALTSFVQQKPTVESIDALEDSELLFMSHDNFFRFIDEIPGWATFYRRILEYAFFFQNKRIEDLVTLNAVERYQKLLTEHPEYVLQLPNKIIASYLDISQETLSRIKTK